MFSSQLDEPFDGFAANPQTKSGGASLDKVFHSAAQHEQGLLYDIRRVNPTPQVIFHAQVDQPPQVVPLCLEQQVDGGTVTPADSLEQVFCLG